MPIVATNGTPVISYFEVGASIDKFVKLDGVIDMEIGGRSMNSMYKYPSAGTIVYVCVIGMNNDATSNPNSISVSSSNTTWNGMTFYAVLQYTKTTDTAISIGSETEYSTDEKVVGTWLDGKPVYQKTIQLPSKVTTTSSGWTTLADVSSLNIGLVIRTDLVDVADNMILTGNLATVVSGSLRVSTVGYTFPCEIVTIQYTKTSS